MKRLFLLFFVIGVTINYSNAQKVTYAQFMEMSKSRNFTELNELVTKRSFSFYKSKVAYSDGVKGTQSYWVKDCTIDFNGDGSLYIRYQLYEDSGFIQATKYDDDEYTTSCPFKIMYAYRAGNKGWMKKFLKDANKDGWRVYKDWTEGEQIYTLYRKAENGSFTYMSISEGFDRFQVEYGRDSNIWTNVYEE